MKELLEHALRVARGMTQDPEAESIAGEAALRAVRTYDGSIPLKQWVSVVVRRDVWYHWRRQARHPMITMGVSVRCTWRDEEPEEPLTPLEAYDRIILWERWIERCPIAAIARKHGESIETMRKLLHNAKQRLIDKHG